MSHEILTPAQLHVGSKPQHTKLTKIHAQTGEMASKEPAKDDIATPGTGSSDMVEGECEDWTMDTGSDQGQDHDQDQGQDQDIERDSWARITGREYDSLFRGTTAEHVTQV